MVIQWNKRPVLSSCRGQTAATDLYKRIFLGHVGKGHTHTHTGGSPGTTCSTVPVTLTEPRLCSVFQVNLALREGSGHFFVNTSVKGIVDVVFQEAQGAVQVKTKQKKHTSGAGGVEE